MHTHRHNYIHRCTYTCINICMPFEWETFAALQLNFILSFILPPSTHTPHHTRPRPYSPLRLRAGVAHAENKFLQHLNEVTLLYSCKWVGFATASDTFIPPPFQLPLLSASLSLYKYIYLFLSLSVNASWYPLWAKPPFGSC